MAGSRAVKDLRVIWIIPKPRRTNSDLNRIPRRSLHRKSGWPSGLRRCVQVAVSPGGVGSNPTSDNILGCCRLLTSNDWRMAFRFQRTLFIFQSKSTGNNMSKVENTSLVRRLISTGHSIFQTPPFVKNEKHLALSEVGFEPTPPGETATWTQRLRPLGHPDYSCRFLASDPLRNSISVRMRGERQGLRFCSPPSVRRS